MYCTAFPVFCLRINNYNFYSTKTPEYSLTLTLTCLCVMVLQWHSEVVRLEQEAAVLQKSCKLFEVSSPDFRQLRLCQRQIFVLKQLWDLLLCAQVFH